MKPKDVGSHLDGYLLGSTHENAVIVKWLRKSADEADATGEEPEWAKDDGIWDMVEVVFALRCVADAIERGEHHRSGVKP